MLLSPARKEEKEEKMGVTTGIIGSRRSQHLERLMFSDVF
jgi:hypothetical protein